MALRVRRAGGPGRGGLVADRRLYRTSTGEPCERGDPRAAFLLAGKGSSIPPEAVERYDMRLEGGRVVWGASKLKGEPPPEPEPVPEPEATESERQEEQAAEPKKLGGGWWELPDGRKVRTPELPEPDDEG
jgi:hypothetical protein